MEQDPKWKKLDTLVRNLLITTVKDSNVLPWVFPMWSSKENEDFSVAFHFVRTPTGFLVTIERSFIVHPVAETHMMDVVHIDYDDVVSPEELPSPSFPEMKQ